jgi:hypothetical protein
VRGHSPSLEGWRVIEHLSVALLAASPMPRPLTISFDQSFFLGPAPSFELTLDGDSIRDPIEVLRPDQS